MLVFIDCITFVLGSNDSYSILLFKYLSLLDDDGYFIYLFDYYSKNSKTY